MNRAVQGSFCSGLASGSSSASQVWAIGELAVDELATVEGAWVILDEELEIVLGGHVLAALKQGLGQIELPLLAPGVPFRSLAIFLNAASASTSLPCWNRLSAAWNSESAAGCSVAFIGFQPLEPRTKGERALPEVSPVGPPTLGVSQRAIRLRSSPTFFLEVLGTARSRFPSAKLPRCYSRSRSRRPPEGPPRRPIAEGSAGGGGRAAGLPWPSRSGSEIGQKTGATAELMTDKVTYGRPDRGQGRGAGVELAPTTAGTRQHADRLQGTP